MYSIDHQTLMEPKIIKDRFWDMFICDAFMANFDRHNGNWGFLYNKMTDDIKLAPVFDCGSCLYSQMNSETMQLVMNDKNEQNARIYNIPASVIKVNGNKLNYMKYLSETLDESCIEAIRRIYPHIDMKKIVNFINGIECITETQKKFYTLMLQKRYDLILKPAYKRAEKMFERFYRADSTSSKVTGHGLGLAIAKNIVDNSRGKIDAKVIDEHSIEINVIF